MENMLDRRQREVGRDTTKFLLCAIVLRRVAKSIALPAGTTIALRLNELWRMNVIINQPITRSNSVRAV